MKTNLLSQLGRAALIAFIGALGLFSAELSGLLPELSGLSTLIVTGLIGLISFAVEKLRDKYNQVQRLRLFSIQEVTITARIGRALLTAVAGGLVVLLSELGGILPDISGFMQVVIGAGAGLISLLLEYLRDRYELLLRT